MRDSEHHAGTLVKSNDLEVSVEAATVLLSLAMRDTDTPAADLGNALSRLSARVHAPLAPKAAGDVHLTRKELESMRAELATDVAICIQSLQFHDRLIQQLAAVRSFLASLADHQALDAGGFGAQRWEELLRLVRTKLTTDSHRQIFDLLLRTGSIDTVAGDLVASEGSVELF
jgi:hypothetical protein